MADSFPAAFEVLFAVPSSVVEEDLKSAVRELAETVKSDLVTVGAPTEVVMEAAACVSQFAKHMQASRRPYGLENGGYLDPGAERMALSSIHQGLGNLRDGLAKLRTAKASPEQVQAAVDDRDMRFTRAAQGLFMACRAQEEPLAGEDLMFWVQGELFTRLKAEGIAE
jgi:hypothetical protein